MRFAQRLPTLLWLGLLFPATFRVARGIAGARAAHLATIGVALDPNLIANASLVTVDCVYALATLLVLWAALRFARAPGARAGALVGLALGFAFAAKFTAVLLALGLLLTPLAAPSEARPLWRSWQRVFAGTLVAAGVTLGVIAVCYLGRGLAQPLGSLRLHSRPLLALARAMPALRPPLPASFLEGIDATLRSERGWGSTVLLGRSHPGGVYYYFPVVWALKTPLLFVGLLLLGIAQTARSRALWRDPALRFLALNLALTLAYFSFLFRAQIGYRFLLMCIPLACILAAVSLQQPRWSPLLGAALALALLENAFYLGNPLSFSNAAVWPKRQVFRLITDANVEQGQNKDKIAGWLAEHGIKAARLDPVHVLPGTNVLSVTNVGGVYDFERFRWLREHFDPTDHFGHTYLRFEVPYEDFDRYLEEERTLAPLPVAGALCPETRGEFSPQRQVAFERATPPEANAAWLGCVDAPRGSDVGYRSVYGMIRIGRVLADGRCDAELIQHEQAVWYRLQPGRHALCAIEVPSRRNLVAYRREGLWILRGRAAALQLLAARLDLEGRISLP
jgi:hypothetical protein